MVSASTTTDRRLSAARGEMERRLRAGTLASAADLSDSYPDLWADADTALELVYGEYVHRTSAGEVIDREAWYQRYPQWRDRLERLFGLYELMSEKDTRGAGGERTVGGLLDPAEAFDEPPGYELLGELGEGGMAVVYKARHRTLNRLVALKVLKGGGRVEAGRVRREAETAARLQHPNIVQIHEVSVWDGMPFLALEYVPGGTLADLLAKGQGQGLVGVSPEQASDLVETIARAMQYAHEQGVIHRDLKPSNILLQSGLLPKVADFGLALSDDGGSTTHSASLVGTPCFMAPEQADARRDRIGPRTDVYALGGILYELLTGRPPFQGATVLETLDLVRHTEPVPPRLLRPQAPADLETVCLKCLSKSPDRRYPTAAALADDLRRFRDGKPILARPVSPVERGVKWVRRHPGVSALAAAIAVLLVSLFALMQGKLQVTETARQKEAELRTELEATRAQELIASARAHWNTSDTAETRRLLALCPDAFRSAEWRNLHAVASAEVSSVPLVTVGSGVPVLYISPSGKLAVVVYKSNLTCLLIDTGTGEVLGFLPYSEYQTHQYFFPKDEDTRAFCGLHSVGKGLRAEQPELSDWVNRRLQLNKVKTQPDLGPRPGLDTKSTPRGTLAIRESPTRITLRPQDDRQAVLSFNLAAYGTCYGFALDTADRHLATVHEKTVVVWDIAARRVVSEFPFRYRADTYQYAIHPDLHTVYWRQRPPAEAAFEGRVDAVVAWDLAANRERFRIGGDYSGRYFKISPDGSRVAVGNYQSVHLYDAQTGRLVTALRGHKSGNPTFEFFPDGKRMLTLSSDKQLKVWDLSAWGE